MKKIVAGIDEAGRGPLAGPVVAATVILPARFYCSEITDSKKLSAKKREELDILIREHALAFSVVAVGAKRIDRLNIREATKVAMSLSLQRVSRQLKPDLVLIDGNMEIYTSLQQKTVIGGDALHQEISAASILAKVWRDRLMHKLDSLYPGYGFSQHAGYPTKLHKKLISELGPSRVHRRFFSGVAEFYRQEPAQVAGF